MATVLEEICAKTRQHVERAKQKKPLATLLEEIKTAAAPKGFIKALQAKAESGRPALITEVKKASPSKGLIREDFDPAHIAKIYEDNGAACISVLTDEPYFQGHDDHLRAVKASVSLPVIRKDFMIDEYQIYESRALGADCVLLIMAALSDEEARAFYGLAQKLGMDVLVEIHDEHELQRAIKFSPAMIGVNNRNLKTLEVDLKTSHEMIRKMPPGIIRVCESGLSDHATIHDLHTKGFEAFLVGESLMRQTEIGPALQTLLGNTV